MNNTRVGESHDWLRRHTSLPDIVRRLSDEPAHGLAAWARTTAGGVAFLFALQFITGALIAAFYVPSADAAHVTVAYVEKAAQGGSWLRALHYHGSQWLPLALLLHLAQLFWRGAHERRPLGWLAAVLLLGLVMANGAIGYSLPWDARAFFSTRVGAGIINGLPLVGEWARAWVLGGGDISTLTLSRLYALHILFVPALLLTIVAVRLFILRESPEGRGGHGDVEQTKNGPSDTRASGQLARNAVAVLLVFLLISIVSLKYPAPLGPEATRAEAGYLPRPGPQFLWLFQLLKYFPPAAASLAAVFTPGLLLGALALLPFLRRPLFGRFINRSRRVAGVAAFATVVTSFSLLSLIAYLEDARDPRAREQLARQARDEEEFRRAPFAPRLTGVRLAEGGDSTVGAAAPPAAVAGGVSSGGGAAPPPAYAANCARCHGTNGEGKSINPPLAGVSARPNRTVEDIVRIINNPRAYNLEKRMPAFAGKLSEQEMRAIAEWVVTLGG